MAMIKTDELVRAYGDFHHMPKTKTWALPRRVIAKVEHRPGQVQRCRFLVTSLKRQQVNPKALYEDTYCPRGDMENRIKGETRPWRQWRRVSVSNQLDLFGDRMSASAFRSNQLRLMLAGFAYVLIDGIRREALANTTLARATPGTIRLKLFKIGARVITSIRRIKLSLPDAYPYKAIFFRAHSALIRPAPT